MALQSDENTTSDSRGDSYANNLPIRPDGEKYASPYEDTQAVSQRIDFFLRKDRFTRWIFEREWFRNILYYIGRHWIIYDNTNRRWRSKSLPVWFPQPYTNKFAEKANDIMGSYQQGRLPINYSPASPDADAIATAEIAEEFRDTFYEETEIEDHEALLASWVTLTGNGFIHSYYDYNEEFGTKFLQHYQCTACGEVSDPSSIKQNGMTCPNCGDPNGNFQPAQDENGQPQGEDIPKGRLRADVLSPFEIRLDPTIPDLLLQRRFTRVRTYDVEFARMYWGGKTDPKGEIIDPKTIVADKESNIGQFYLDAISYITSTFGAGGGFIAGGGSAFKLPRVTAYEYYELPTDDFPQGLHAVRLGHTSNLVTVSEPLDTQYGAGEFKGRYFLPLVHFGQDRVPGRLWRKTRMDDLISLQNFRNLVEAAMKVTAQRTGNPLWLNPKGSGVANMTGEPGQWVDYNPVSVGGTSFAKPERVPADLSNVQGFTVLINKIDDSMERVAGTFFLQGGECVTEDTECLTPRGWTHQRDLRVGDKVYSIDPITKDGIWADVNRIYRNPNYSGPIFKVHSQTICGRFTPGHDFLVGNLKEYEYKKNGKGRPRTRQPGLSKLPIEKLNSDHYIPAGFSLNRPIEEKHSDDYVSLVGWVVTDGHYDRERHRVAVSQSRMWNGRKCRAIEGIYTRLFGEKQNHWFISRKEDGMNEYSFYKGADFIAAFPEKRLTSTFINELSTRQLKILLDAMLEGDGHFKTRDKKRKHHSARFSSADPILANQFQMVATLAGYTTNQSFRENKWKGEYRVSLKTTKKINVMRFLPHVTEEKFEGMVWCPNTSTGNWVARNSGKVFVTGNTPPGVTAASALAYLGEKAQQSISPLKREWAKGWKRWEMQMLELARKYWDDERIVALAGANRHWEIKKFMSADLQGAVKLDIDYEGLFKKSTAARRADIAQLEQMKVINPMDPETQWAILEAFGETELTGSRDLDMREASIEWDDFCTLGVPPTIIPLIQNSQVHMLQHTMDAKTDRFKALPLPMQKMWEQHVQATQQDIMAQAALNAPPQQPPSESINYKDLPPEGQVQLAKKGGIDISGEQALAQIALQRKPAPGTGPANIGGPSGSGKPEPAPIRKGKAAAGGGASEITPQGDKNAG